MAMKVGESGVALQLGDASASLLVERVSESDDSVRMPPEGGPLNADQIAALTQGI